MKLSAFLQTVYLPSRIEVSSDYAAHLAAVVGRFSAHLGRDAMLVDLTEQHIAAYLMTYRRERSPRSTNNQRQSLLCLWRAAFDFAMVAAAPRARLIRRLPVEHDPPESWTTEQIGQLIATAATLPGEVAGIPRAGWWTSLLLTAFWSACRIGALMKAPSANYRGGMILVRGQKNHRSQLYVLPPSCCAEIDATEPQTRTLLWPWPHCRRHLFTEMRRLCELAGLPCEKKHGDLFHKLRRTTLSLCAAVDPAIAQRQAGHASYATTQTHYIDPRIARGPCAADVLSDPLAVRPQVRICA